MKSYKKIYFILAVTLLMFSVFSLYCYAATPQPSGLVVDCASGQETINKDITLNISAADAVFMQFSNDGVNYTSPAAIEFTKDWDITDTAYGGTTGYGGKTVYCKVLNDDLSMEASTSINITFVDSSTVVNIPDVNLNSAIRTALSKPTGYITQADMLTLTTLSANTRDISDLSGLQYATNLLDLQLQDNNITDITPLQPLVKLKSLMLDDFLTSDARDNNISDITPLANMTELETLQIARNNIADITPLQNLIKVKILQLYGNPISDISPLQNYTALQSLQLTDTLISSISVLSDKLELTTLQISNTNVNDLTPLSGLPALDTLGAGNIKTTDITPLLSIATITSLNLQSDNLSDLTVLQQLTNLHSLNLRYNQIADIEPLTLNSGIGTGDVVLLAGNPLSITSRNTYIPNLQTNGATVIWDIITTTNILSFSLPGQVSSNIVGNNITVIMPPATDLSNLTPSIVHNGLTVAPASGATQNFNTPVDYTVTPEQGSANVYTVTVQVAKGSIHGTITDSTSGMPIQGATIDLGGGLTTTTNSSGSYNLNNIDMGNYNLTITHAGYNDINQNISFTAADYNKTLNLQMNQVIVSIPGTIFIDTHGALIGAASPYSSYYERFQTQVEVVSGGSVVYTVTTDATGKVQINSVPLGTYTVRLKTPTDMTTKGAVNIYTDLGATRADNVTEVTFTLTNGSAQYVTFVSNVPPPLVVYGNVFYYTGTTDSPTLTPIANAQITVDDTYTGSIDANGQFFIDGGYNINFVGNHKVKITTTESNNQINVEFDQLLTQNFNNTDTVQFNLNLSDVKISAITGGYSGQLVIFKIYNLHAQAVTPPQTPSQPQNPVQTPSTPAADPEPEQIPEPVKEPEQIPIPEPVITGTVKGRVTSEDGTPLANIRIELHSEPRYTFTDKDGYYIFENVELGEHTISIKDDKFQEKAKNLKDIKIVLELDKDKNVVVKSVQDSKQAFTDLKLDSKNTDKIINFVVVPKIPEQIKELPKTGEQDYPVYQYTIGTTIILLAIFIFVARRRKRVVKI